MIFQDVEAQNLFWAKQFGSTATDNGNSLTVDAYGNVYIVGDFNGVVDFDPSTGTLNLTSSGSYDGFIAKLDVAGNLMWAKRIGGIGNDAANAVVLDAYGNIYVSGGFNNTVDFDPGLLTFNVVSFAAADGFILKLDASGNFVWVKQMGGTGSEEVNAIAIDVRLSKNLLVNLCINFKAKFHYAS